MTGDNERGTAIAYAIPGADMPTQKVVASGSSMSPLCPAITPTTSVNKLIFGVFTKGDNRPHTSTGITKLGDTGYSSGGCVSAFWKTWNSTSEHGQQTVTMSLYDDYCSMTIVVPEAASGHDLTANGITSSPVLGKPTIGQTHILASVGITSSTSIR